MRYILVLKQTDGYVDLIFPNSYLLVLAILVTLEITSEGALSIEYVFYFFIGVNMPSMISFLIGADSSMQDLSPYVEKTKLR